MRQPLMGGRNKTKTCQQWLKNNITSSLHRITDPIQYVSSILSINIRYVSRYFLHYCQIGLKTTKICDVERSFPGGNFMI